MQGSKLAKLDLKPLLKGVFTGQRRAMPPVVAFCTDPEIPEILSARLEGIGCALDKPSGAFFGGGHTGLPGVILGALDPLHRHLATLVPLAIREAESGSGLGPGSGSSGGSLGPG